MGLFYYAGIALFTNREPLAGFIIQATEMVEYEDGLEIGNQLKAQNGLQRVYTTPWGSTRGSLHTQIPPRAD